MSGFATLAVNTDVVLRLFVVGVGIGVLYALLGVGLSLIFGLMELINFTHGSFALLAPVVLFLLLTEWGLPYAFSFVLAIGIVALIAIALGRTVVREIKDIPLLANALALIGLALIIENGILLFFTPSPRVIPFPIRGSLELGPVVLQYVTVFSIVTTIGTFVLFFWFLYRTRTGTAMRATFQNDTAAAAVGINVNRIYLLGFVVGTLFAALAGVLYSSIYVLTFGLAEHVLFIAFIVVILGGVGRIFGVMAAGVAIGLIEQFSAYFLSPQFTELYVFAIVILVLLLKPEGIFRGM